MTYIADGASHQISECPLSVFGGEVGRVGQEVSGRENLELSQGITDGEF